MTPVQRPPDGLVVRRVGRRWWHVPVAVAGLPILVALVAAGTRTRAGGTLAFDAAAVVVLLAWGQAVALALRWRSIDLVVDRDGVRLGGTRTAPASAPLHVSALPYAAPWAAVSGPVLVEDPHVCRDLRRAAWTRGRTPTAGVPRVPVGAAVAATPPFFAGGAPTLVFDVDLGRCRLPQLPTGTRASTRWAVPLRDPGPVLAAFAAHGHPVARGGVVGPIGSAGTC